MFFCYGQFIFLDGSSQMLVCLQYHSAIVSTPPQWESVAFALIDTSAQFDALITVVRMITKLSELQILCVIISAYVSRNVSIL